MKKDIYLRNRIGFTGNIKKKEESPEELALKAEQSDKKPEDFDSINSYISI